MHLGHVAEEIQHRLQHLFARDEEGRRAVNYGNDMLDFDPNWKDYLWFYEYFDADTGRGMGASHQCGWSGLVAKMIHDTGANCRLPQTPRTPSTAAAHYFDDVFSRPSKAMGEKPRVRRSSTGRSIGNRSSYNASTNGEADGHSVNGSAHTNGDGERRRSEANQHIADYVTDQLERMRTHESVFDEDEFEAQLE